MAKKPVYPLLQVLDIKKKRLEEARKLVKQREEELAKEEAKLKELEAARDKVKEHHVEKKLQLRAEMDAGSTSDKIKQAKIYLDIVKHNLEVEEEKVASQNKEVDKAKKNLEDAKAELRAQQQEVDKLTEHQKEWQKASDKEQAMLEEKANEDIADSSYLSRMHKNKE